MTPDSVLLLSGGIDSTTLLAHLANLDMRPLCLIFDYGQTLRKEVGIAQQNARRYGCESRVIDLDLSWTAPRCGLFSGAVPVKRSVNQIAAAGTPLTYVPFRNGVFLSVAVAYAEGHNLEKIYCGGNGLHSGNYWDDTTEFAAAFQQAARQGTSPYYHPEIIFTFANMPKHMVLEYGRSLGVDYTRTWSCYLNEDQPCGVCDSCVQRKAAFNHE